MQKFLWLHHGRKDPDTDMDDWGYDGPIIGPFDSIKLTYGKLVLFHADAAFPVPMHKDLIKHGDDYYGDAYIINKHEKHGDITPVEQSHWAAELKITKPIKEVSDE